MQHDLSHLHALLSALSNERARLACAGSGAEREWRAVKVAQLKREIAGEYEFLGIDPAMSTDELDDDDLLRELMEN